MLAGGRVVGESRNLVANLRDVIRGRRFRRDRLVARDFVGSDQHVELEVKGSGVSILRARDDEHHDEGNDRTRRIHNELPCVGEMEARS